jgi:type I restriction enzyme, S subunit
MKDDDKRTLTPRLRFPEFRDQDGWCSRELGPMTSKVGSGITPTGGEAKYKSSGRPFVRSQNVGWGELILDDVAYIDEETHRSFDSSEIATLDVLLNITGASIGRSAIADSRIVGGNVNQHVCIIRVKPDELNPVLLNQYLISEHGQKQIDSFQAGGNRQGLNFGQIRSFQITLPPTEGEQTRIADCLTSLDELIAGQRRKVEALKAHKKGLMQQLFPREGETLPRLRFPEFRNAPEWEEASLGEIAEIKLGKMLNSEKHTTGRLLPYLNNVSLRWNEVDTSHLPQMYFDDDELDRFGLNAGDVVCEGGEPGRSAVWDGRLPDLKFQKAIHRVRFNVPFEPRLLVLYLETIAGTTRFEMLFTGGGIKHLTRETFAKLKVPLVPFPEQHRIAACLSALDARIAAETDKLTALKTHKRGLMQQLFPSPEGD